MDNHEHYVLHADAVENVTPTLSVCGVVWCADLVWFGVLIWCWLGCCSGYTAFLLETRTLRVNIMDDLLSVK